jgi:hypothetical protein
MWPRELHSSLLNRKKEEATMEAASATTTTTVDPSISTAFRTIGRASRLRTFVFVLALVVLSGGLLGILMSILMSIWSPSLSFAQPVGRDSTGANSTAATPACGPDWQVVLSPSQGTNDSYLNSVGAVSSTDVWAVGYYNTNGSAQSLVENWNGTRWKIVPNPNLGIYDNLQAVTAVSPNDVWAVGEYAANTATFLTLIEHWNGTQWSIVPSPSPGTTDNFLKSIVAVSSNDVWAVGDYYNGSRANTLIERWNGTAWNIVLSPNHDTYDNVLNSVAAVSSNDVWAVGSYYNGPANQTLIEHWNGTQWSFVPSPNPGSGNDRLSSVAIASSTDVWAVGSYVNGTANQTLVERYNPCSPGTTPTPTPAPACAITFTDVPPGSTFYPYVRCLACQGIISGYPDGTFKPNSNVTRGQAAKIVANAAGYRDTIPPDRQTFNDVPPTNTFWVYIERVALHGAISGYQCGGQEEPCPGAYFRPANILTRGQVAKIVANVAQYNEQIPANRQSFDDVPPDSTFWVYIERVYLHGVINGYQCGGQGEPCPGAYFRPGNNVTRGQTAKIVANTLVPNCSQPRK